MWLKSQPRQTPTSILPRRTGRGGNLEQRENPVQSSLPHTLRYVVLRHEDIPEPHFDLMFETTPGSDLATWRSDRWPIDAPTPLVKLADHRPAYLEYEGPISGNRGSVRRVAAGWYHPHECSRTSWRLSVGRAAGPVQLLIESDGVRWLAKPITG